MEPRKHYFAKIPTIAIFIVMAMSGPLGVLLFILKGIDKKMLKEEQEAARARGDYRPDPEPASTQKANASYGQDIPTAEQKSAKQWHKNIATLCTIMGAVFLLAGVTDAVDVISVWKFWPDPGELFSDIVMAIGGGGALLTGLRMKSTRKLERLLDKVVGERDNISLPELFAAAGVDAARGRAAVKSAIEHGYFGACKPFLGSACLSAHPLLPAGRRAAAPQRRTSAGGAAAHRLQNSAGAEGFFQL